MRLRSGTVYNNLQNNDGDRIKLSIELPRETVHPRVLRRTKRLQKTSPSSPLSRVSVSVFKNNNGCDKIQSNNTSYTWNEQPPTILETVAALFALKGTYCCERAKTCKMMDRICCGCSDLRPKEEETYAYDNSWMCDRRKVKRSHYYCMKCQ